MENDDLPAASLKPWPLAFTIFGLGLLLSIAFALLFSLTGCAQTSIQAKNFTMKTQANMAVCDVKSDGSFRIEGLNHSTPTLAGGKAFSNGTATFGSAATGLAAGLLSHGL
jgi:hypothetical protein